MQTLLTLLMISIQKWNYKIDCKLSALLSLQIKPTRGEISGVNVLLKWIVLWKYWTDTLSYLSAEYKAAARRDYLLAIPLKTMNKHWTTAEGIQEVAVALRVLKALSELLTTCNRLSFWSAKLMLPSFVSKVQAQTVWACYKNTHICY